MMDRQIVEPMTNQQIVKPTFSTPKIDYLSSCCESDTSVGSATGPAHVLIAHGHHRAAKIFTDNELDWKFVFEHIAGDDVRKNLQDIGLKIKESFAVGRLLNEEAKLRSLAAPVAEVVDESAFLDALAIPQTRSRASIGIDFFAEPSNDFVAEPPVGEREHAPGTSAHAANPSPPLISAAQDHPNSASLEDTAEAEPVPKVPEPVPVKKYDTVHAPEESEPVPASKKSEPAPAPENSEPVPASKKSGKKKKMRKVSSDMIAFKGQPSARRNFIKKTHSGKVKFFNAEEGYGFIEGNDGTDYYVRREEVHFDHTTKMTYDKKGKRTLPTLGCGEPVEFNVVREWGKVKVVDLSGPNGAAVIGECGIHGAKNSSLNKKNSGKKISPFAAGAPKNAWTPAEESVKSLSEPVIEKPAADFPDNFSDSSALPWATRGRVVGSTTGDFPAWNLQESFETIEEHKANFEYPTLVSLKKPSVNYNVERVGELSDDEGDDTCSVTFSEAQSTTSTRKPTCEWPVLQKIQGEYDQFLTDESIRILNLSKKLFLSHVIDSTGLMGKCLEVCESVNSKECREQDLYSNQAAILELLGARNTVDDEELNNIAGCIASQRWGLILRNQGELEGKLKDRVFLLLKAVWLFKSCSPFTGVIRILPRLALLFRSGETKRVNSILDTCATIHRLYNMKNPKLDAKGGPIKIRVSKLDNDGYPVFNKSGKVVTYLKTIHLADDYAWNNASLRSSLERALLSKSQARKLLTSLKFALPSGADNLASLEELIRGVIGDHETAAREKLNDATKAGDALSERILAPVSNNNEKGNTVVKKSSGRRKNVAVRKMSRSERKKYKKEMAARNSCIA